MYLPDGFLKNIFSRNFLQVVIKTLVAEFTFSKLPCFQHILVNTFPLTDVPKHENYSLGGILF